MPAAALLGWLCTAGQAVAPVPIAPAATPAVAAAAPLPDGLPDSLRLWLDRLGGDSLQVQVAVMDLRGRGEGLLYGRAAELRQTPASLVKLLTAAAALELWGPRHRLTTRAGYEPALATVDRRTGRKRAGTLWVQPAGDPSLSRRDLVRLFHQLWQDGVDRVDQVLILPNTFDPLRLGPGWMWDDAGVAYAARPSLLTVQGNCLVARPGPGAWELPGSALMRVETEPAARGATPMLQRDWWDARDRFTFMAPLLSPGQAAGGDRWWVRPPQPSCNVEHPDSLFRSVCHEAAQEVFAGHGPVRLDGVPPARGVAWFRHAGPPLEQVLDSVLTESWNLGAECVFQGLAAAYPRAGASGWERAAELSREVLQERVGMMGWFRQVDGSGMSRYNLVAPRQFAQLLAAMERRMPGRLASLLPGPGEGTLRTAAPTLAPGVSLRAKTGSLRGVTALAGYLGLADGPRLSFALIISGQAEGNTAMRLRNQILRRLAEWLAAAERRA